jgi:hypothetical protein
MPEHEKAKYAQEFCENIDEIFSTKHRDYAQEFIVHLNPIDLGRDSDREILEKIFEGANENRTHFRKYLKIVLEDHEDIISKRI